LADVSPAAIRAAFRSRVERLAASPDSAVFEALAGGEVVGLAGARHLAWDSEIFGFPCARLEVLGATGGEPRQAAACAALLEAVEAWSRGAGIATLHARADLEDRAGIHALEAGGFRLITVVVKHYFDGRRPLPVVRTLATRLFREADLEGLKAIARGAFDLNRYSLDPHYPPERVAELYARWTENACRGLVQDAVVVAERGGEPVGFLTCGLERELGPAGPLCLGVIHLTAVRADLRGRGIIPACLKGGMEWFVGRADLIETVVAVQNDPTLRILTRFGFRYRAGAIDFHRWLR
jgi:RimJ/RimL family protein N-acetyltransferase